MKLKFPIKPILFSFFLLTIVGVKYSNAQLDSAILTIPKGLDLTKYSFQDTSGKEVTIKNFKGKYIFLDIWASWCRPCINEFPSFDSLREKLVDKNIVFLQLSIDEMARRWNFSLGMNRRKTIATQWLASNKKDFMTDLKVAYIPRYLLIDTNGKLIDPKMTKPSDAETLQRILNLKGI